MNIQMKPDPTRPDQTTPLNAARATAVRVLLALGLTGVVALPATAASVGNTAAQNIQARNGQTQNRQNGQGQMQPDLKVSYYTADPSKGGQIISTLTLSWPTYPQTGNQRVVPTPGATQSQLAQRQSAQGQLAQNQLRPINPIVAQAPAGARFAVIQGRSGGERVIDLAQADQMRGPGFGGPGRAQRGDSSGQPDMNWRGPGQRGDQYGPPRN